MRSEPLGVERETPTCRRILAPQDHRLLERPASGDELPGGSLVHVGIRDDAAGHLPAGRLGVLDAVAHRQLVTQLHPHHEAGRRVRGERQRRLRGPGLPARVLVTAAHGPRPGALGGHERGVGLLPGAVSGAEVDRLVVEAGGVSPVLVEEGGLALLARALHLDAAFRIESRRGGGARALDLFGTPWRWEHCLWIQLLYGRGTFGGQLSRQGHRSVAASGGGCVSSTAGGAMTQARGGSPSLVRPVSGPRLCGTCKVEGPRRLLRADERCHREGSSKRQRTHSTHRKLPQV